MNERIKELIEQCTEVYPIKPRGPWFDKEKFAKLILLDVRLLIADERIEYYSDEADDALVSVLISIEKHFGVEE